MDSCFHGNDTNAIVQIRLSIEEVGEEFGVTQERIRQIEAKAIRKLRHPTRAKKLRDYLWIQTERTYGANKDTEALVNGAVNAAYKGDFERVSKNLSEIERRLFNSVSAPVGKLIEEMAAQPLLERWSEEEIDKFLRPQRVYRWLHETTYQDLLYLSEPRRIYQAALTMQAVRTLKARIPKEIKV